MVCRTGTRYCRDGLWSECESVQEFEVPVDRTKAVRSLAQALIDPDAGVVCDDCSPACRRLTDPLKDPGTPPPSHIVYTPDGEAITLDSQTQGGMDSVTDNASCKVMCTNCSVVVPKTYDYDCDGIADDYEDVTTSPASVRPFSMTATPISMTLGPGESATSTFQTIFGTRTVDVYFLIDTASASSELIDAIKNNLVENQSIPGTPFFYDSNSTLDGCATRGKGILGDLQCLLPDVGFGIGFTRDVPFEGPVSGITYGWDMISGSTLPSPITRNGQNYYFSDVLFEHLEPIATSTSAWKFEGTQEGTVSDSSGYSPLRRLTTVADPDPDGPNGQLQGLWAVATGSELFTGMNRPGVPEQIRCPASSFGYPCFRRTSSSGGAVTPIVVLITGSPFYNGPTTDWKDAPISMPGSYPASYPSTLYSGKVQVGSYSGYMHVLRPTSTSAENFANPFIITSQIDPNSTTGAIVGSVHDDLLTFAGDTTDMLADVDASFISCNGVVNVTGADAVHLFTLNNPSASTTRVHITTKGSRFPSILGIVKQPSGSGTPAINTQDLTTYCCLDPNNPDPCCSNPNDTGCTGTRPAGCCLATTECGDTSDDPYDVGTINPGAAMVLNGNLVQGGNYPVDLLECFSHANVSQCGQGNKATDVAPDSVFKFNLSQDMALNVWSDAETYDTNMAIFASMPGGVTDVRLGTNPASSTWLRSCVGGSNEGQYCTSGNDCPDGYCDTAINGHAYRVIGLGSCAGGTKDGQDCKLDADCPGGICDSNKIDGCNGFLLDNQNATYTDAAIFDTATDMTPDDTTYACSSIKGSDKDIEFPFSVNKDGTVVTLSTAGDQPALELQGSAEVAVAIRQVRAPGAQVSYADGTNDDFDSAWPVLETDFTPTTVNKFADVQGTIAGTENDYSNFDVLTNYYNAYRCTSGSTQGCVLPSTPVQDSCLTDAQTMGFDQFLASTPDIVYKFEIATPRDLKIAAVGRNGAKHHLALFSEEGTNWTNGFPSANEVATNVAEPLYTLPAATSYTSLTAGESSSGSQTFALVDASTTKTFTLPSITSSSLSYDLPDMTSSTASFALTAGVSSSLVRDVASTSSSSQTYNLAASYNGAGHTYSIPTSGTSYSSGPFGLTSFTVLTPQSLAMPTLSASVAVTRNRAANTDNGTTTFAASGENINNAFAWGTLSEGKVYHATQNLGTASNKEYASRIDCGSQSENDQVFTFTAPASSTTATIKLTGSTYADYSSTNTVNYPVFQVYTALSTGAGGTTTVSGTACTLASSSTGASVSFATTANQVYYIAVTRYKGGSASANLVYNLDVTLDSYAGGDTTLSTPSPLPIGTDSVTSSTVSFIAGRTVNVSGTALTTAVGRGIKNDYPTTTVSCANASAFDQVLTFTTDSSFSQASLRLTTTGSGFTPAVVVYKQDNAQANKLGTQVGSCVTGSATLQGSVAGSTTYYIIVSGTTAGAGGTYSLSLRLEATNSANVVVNARTLTAPGLGDTLNVSGTGLDLSDGQIESDYGTSISCDNPTALSDQVFAVTPSASGSLSVKVTSTTTFQPTVSVYPDSSGALGAEANCGAATSSAVGASAVAIASVTSGTKYYIVVSSKSNVGKYQLDLTLNNVAGGDTIAAGVPLSLGSLGAGDSLSATGLSLTTQNSGTTANYDSGTDRVGCNAGSPRDQVLTFTASALATATVTVTSSGGWTPAVAVWEDNGSNAFGNQLGGCSSSSIATVTGDTTAGKAYYIIVSGATATDAGWYTVSVRLDNAATGNTTAAGSDDMDVGTISEGQTEVVSGTNLTLANAGITSNYDANLDCNNPGAVDQVLAFKTSIAGSLSVTVTSTTAFNPAIAVFQKDMVGGPPNLGTQLGSCAKGSAAAIGASATVLGTSAANQTYYLIVSGATAAVGTYSVSITLNTLTTGDTVASPIALNTLSAGQSLSLTGTGFTTNNSAITADNDASISCNAGTTPDQVFSFTAAARATLSVTATAVSFGTGGSPVISVWSDNGSGSALGSQLGTCATSSYTGTTTAGTKYYILISGSATTAKGVYSLSVSLSAPPGGDTTAEAVDLGTLTLGDTLGITGTALTTNSPLIGADYDSAMNCKAAGAPDQVLTFTAGSAGSVSATVTANAFSNGTPAIVMYAASGATGLGAQLGSCRYGSSATVTGPTSAGQKYYVIIGGNGSTSAKGTYTLTLTFNDLAGGDTTATALSLGSVPYGRTVSVSGSGLTTDNANIDDDYSSANTCAASGAPDQVVSLTVSSTGTLNATVSAAYPSGNAAVAIFRDNGSGGLGAQVGSCQTGGNTVSGLATAGTYYIVVSGTSTAAKGNYLLVVALDSAASGDTVASPLSIGSFASANTVTVSGSGVTTNNSALTADNDGSISCNTGGSPDQVIAFVPTETTIMTVSVTGVSGAFSGVPAVAVWAGNGSGGLSATQIGACSAGATASVTGRVTANTTYYILVSGSGTNAKGDYTLTLALGARASGDTIASALALGTFDKGDQVAITGDGLTTNNGAINQNYAASVGCDGGGTPPDQVLSFYSTANTTASVTVSSSSYAAGAPSVAIYADSGGSLGAQVGSCSSSSPYSVVGTVTGSAGSPQLYYIVVSGSGTSAVGSYELNVALDDKASGDTAATALDLGTLASGVTFTASGTGLTTSNGNITANYDNDGGADRVSCNAAGDTANDQVLKFTTFGRKSFSAKITANTYSGGTPAIVVYEDAISGTPVGPCAVGAGATSSGATSSGTHDYYIVVSGSVTAAKGGYTLSVTLGSNLFDSDTNPGTISLAATGTAYVTNTTAGITGRSTYSDYDAALVDCNVGSSAPDHLYKVTGATPNSEVNVHMVPAGFAGAVAVYSDGGSGPGTKLGCYSNTAPGGTVETAVTPPSGTFYVIVTGANNGSGTYSLQIAKGTHDTLGGAHDFGTIDGANATVTNTTSQPGVRQDYDATDYVSCNNSSGGASTQLGYDQVYKFHVGSAAQTRVTVTLTPSSAWYGVVQIREASGGVLSTSSATDMGCSNGGGANTTPRQLTFSPNANTDYYVIVTGYTNTDRGAYTLNVKDAFNGNLGCAASTAPERAVVTVKNLPKGTYYAFLKVDTASVYEPDPNYVEFTIEDGTWSTGNGIWYCEMSNYTPYEASFKNNWTSERSVLQATLDQGDYVAVLKGVGASSMLKFIIRDNAYQPDVLACHDTNLNGFTQGGTITYQGQKLQEPKTYFTADGKFKACVDDQYITWGTYTDPLTGATSPVQTGCQDGKYIDYYLVMRATKLCSGSGSTNCASSGSSASNPYTVHIQDGEVATPVSTCDNGNVPDTFNGDLANGNYYLIVKGMTADDRGPYQVTVGKQGTSATVPYWSTGSFADVQSYSSVAAKLVNPGSGLSPIKVIGIQDGTESTTKSQLQRIASDTSTMAITNTPLVTQIDSAAPNFKTVFSTTDVGYGITRSIQELAQSLVMDVTAVLDPDPAYANPGFSVNILATGTEPNCMGGKTGPDSNLTPVDPSLINTWRDCHLTAMPRFEITVLNPSDAPVAAATYTMMLDIVGKVQIGGSALNPIYRNYIVYQIPLTVTSTSSSSGSMSGKTFDITGTYSEQFYADRCLAVEAPDWSRLTLDAIIPDDSSLEFHMCTAATSGGADTCAPSTSDWLEVTSGAACIPGSSTCGANSFCHDRGVCWTIKGPACTSNTKCGTNGTCAADGRCYWSKLPVDVGSILGGSAAGTKNGLKYARMDVVLNASSDRKSAPTLSEWNIEYDCVSGE